MREREGRQGGRYLKPVTRSTKSTDVVTKKRLAAIAYAQGSIAHLAPGRNLADELIADRRAEARTVRSICRR